MFSFFLIVSLFLLLLLPLVIFFVVVVDVVHLLLFLLLLLLLLLLLSFLELNVFPISSHSPSWSWEPHLCAAPPPPTCRCPRSGRSWACRRGCWACWRMMSRSWRPRRKVPSPPWEAANKERHTAKGAKKSFLTCVGTQGFLWALINGDWKCQSLALPLKQKSVQNILHFPLWLSLPPRPFSSGEISFFLREGKFPSQNRPRAPTYAVSLLRYLNGMYKSFSDNVFLDGRETTIMYVFTTHICAKYT